MKHIPFHWVAKSTRFMQKAAVWNWNKKKTLKKEEKIANSKRVAVERNHSECKWTPFQEKWNKTAKAFSYCAECRVAPSRSVRPFHLPRLTAKEIDKKSFKTMRRGRLEVRVKGVVTSSVQPSYTTWHLTSIHHSTNPRTKEEKAEKTYKQTNK